MDGLFDVLAQDLRPRALAALGAVLLLGFDRLGLRRLQRLLDGVATASLAILDDLADDVMAGQARSARGA
jgi:hypothetical protein